MDFLGALKVLRRRWYIALGAVLVSVGMALLTFVSIATVYESSGVAVLTSPAAGARFSEGTRPEDVQRINPLLAFDGSLTTSAQILRQILRDPATMEELDAGRGAPVHYDVTNGDATTSGPFLFVVADGDSAQASQAMVARVLDRARSELDSRQKAVDAPPPTFIQAELLVKPTVAEAKINGKIRYAGATLVLTLIVSLAATFALDNLLNARAGGGARPAGGPAAFPGPPPGAPTFAQPYVQSYGPPHPVHVGGPPGPSSGPAAPGAPPNQMPAAPPPVPAFAGSGHPNNSGSANGNGTANGVSHNDAAAPPARPRPGRRPAPKGLRGPETGTPSAPSDASAD